MRHALPIAAVWLGGCLGFINGGDGSECEFDSDCPREFVCDRQDDRCVERDGPGPTADLGRPPPRDMQALDEAVPDAAVPDMLVPPIPDAGPDMAPDLGPDAAVDTNGPYGLAADCFGGEERGELATLSDQSTHVPRSVCASHLVAWTEEVDGELRLRFHDMEAFEAPQLGPVLMPDTRLVAERDVVLLSAPHPRFGVPNIQAWTPGDEEPTALQPRNAVQTQPARLPGLSAFVERGDTVRHVRLHFDDPLDGDIDCIRGNRHQWGVVLGPDYTAFFERNVGSRRTDLVITRGWRCDGASRVVLPLPGRVADDARLAAGDSRLFWIASDPNTRLRALWAVDRADLVGGARVYDPPGFETLNPVDVAARGKWLAVVNYEPGGYRLDLFDLDAGRQRILPNSGSNALDPSFSDTYLLWAEQAAAQPWEVRYARLDRL